MATTRMDTHTHAQDLKAADDHRLSSLASIIATIEDDKRQFMQAARTREVLYSECIECAFAYMCTCVPLRVYG